MSARRVRREVATVAQNPNLQLVGSDPAGGGYDLGIFIGANGSVTAPTMRQLFLLASASFNTGQRGRLVGFRQYLTIGVQQPVTAPSGPAFYFLERPVETPTWKYVDGNVLWGIRKVPPGLRQNPNVLNGDGLAFEYANTPAQLFESIAAGVITPPYGGGFPGNVLTPELGRFYDLRCRRWAEPVQTDIEFEGPCDIILVASVQQTNPATRTPPIIVQAPFAPVSDQTSGADEPPDDTGSMNYTVVTTTGIHASIGQLYYNDGSNTATPATQQLITAMPGNIMVAAADFTGGTISFNAGQAYMWTGAAWVPWPSASSSQYLTTQGAVPEDAFVQNYPGSTYGRIGGSLIFEYEEQAPTGAPKTYRSFGSADRITRDTTETGDNTMRQSAEVTNKHPHCNSEWGGEWRERHDGLGKVPMDNRSRDAVRALAQRWRHARPPGSSSTRFRDTTEPPTPQEGLGHVPERAIRHSMDVIRSLSMKYRPQGIGMSPEADERSQDVIRALKARYGGGP
jgi:hypothetical protein